MSEKYNSIECHLASTLSPCLYLICCPPLHPPLLPSLSYFITFSVPLPRPARCSMSGGGGGLNVPLEDERELLAVGTQAVASGTTRQPILGSYLPVNPVQRYTFKKWAPDDWSRHNESKKFQSNRDREAARV